MNIRISKPTLIISVGIGALLITGGAIAINQDTPPKVITSNSPSHTSKVGTSSAAADSPSPATQTNANSSAKQSGSAASSPANNVTPACKTLTLAIAQQVLGANTKAANSSDTASLKTANTTVSACAYSGANGTAQLTVRTSKDSLGVSENATVFGSEKPSNAVNLSGYGQASYWDPAKLQLNFLSNNDWYIITRNTNSQADAEAVAKLLVQGL